MNEAVTHLEHHATGKDDYELFKRYYFYSMALYKKKYEDHIYNEIITSLWNPDHLYFFDIISVEIMLQQRYKDSIFARWKYFYALAEKVEIEDAAIIVMTSANINDHNKNKDSYKNTIIENANLFKTDIDSEDYIRKGELKKRLLI
ncbi:hypothetical protein YYG_03836 [Plasmodium vinckei petteri]|uniref:Fam-a protein n=1 Tax=Plasmodium vinckei petteri TaxID=138298 RepID=W7AJ13_PLAVN|nr:hypothetical protein YYG_03836 [Plasmodium vinckei petteri]